MFPLVTAEVAELIAAAAGHVNASGGFLDDVLAVVTLAVVEGSLEELEVLAVAVAVMIRE